MFVIRDQRKFLLGLAPSCGAWCVLTPERRTHPIRILIADDEANIRRILETRLRLAGFEVAAAVNGMQALELFRSFEPDALVLDVMMPELDGFAVTERIRAQSEVPIILLTSLSDVGDRLTGLKLGADDYILKPFSPKELELRIRCVLRRSSPSLLSGKQANNGAERKLTSSHWLLVGNFKVDLTRRKAYRGDERIRLTGMEFSLLELLINRAGEPVSRLDILEQVWGYKPTRSNDSRVVDVHISRLRAKVEEDVEVPELILTTRGKGYMFRRTSQEEMSLKV